MVVSHANDSLFWVLTHMSRMDVKTGHTNLVSDIEQNIWRRAPSTLFCRVRARPDVKVDGACRTINFALSVGPTLLSGKRAGQVADAPKPVWRRRKCPAYQRCAISTLTEHEASLGKPRYDAKTLRMTCNWYYRLQSLGTLILGFVAAVVVGAVSLFTL